VHLAASSATPAPEWLAILSLALAPVLALVGAVFGAWLQRRSAKDSLANAVATRVDQRLGALELDKWRRREETMRMLRWASEHAVSRDARLSDLGVTTLIALKDSNPSLLQQEDRAIVDAVLEAINRPTVSAYDEIVESGDSPVVVVDLEESTDDGSR
jgi:hypothetical protein